MIRINLLQEKKKSARVDRGNKSLLTGVGIIAAAAALVVFLVHLPLGAAIDEVKEENSKRGAKIKKLTEDTKEFDTVQAQLKAAQDQEDAIKRLNSARAVPSWMLNELSNILTKDHKPTMSPEMGERIKNDANRQFSPGWDPKRIWINTLEEKESVMTLSGGAQSTADATQFSLRLQASVFFTDVQVTLVHEAVDNASKLGFYNFTLTGKVLY
jgi:Tfp pilus assembly protein PilN